MLSTDIDNPTAVPYFLWDQPITVAEVRRRLAEGDDNERFYLIGKIMREARDTDVWRFTTPREVRDNWDKIARYLGRRRVFWEFLFEAWESNGWIEEAMNIERLSKYRSEIIEIAKRHGASNIRVFGSVARGEADSNSDVDFLVDLEKGRSLFDLGGLLVDLERLLGRRVDVVTENGLRPRIKDRVMSEARAI